MNRYGVATAAFILIITLISVLIASPEFQSVFVYLHVLPFYSWIDYSTPELPQFMFTGIPTATSHYVESSSNSRIGMWHIKSEENSKKLLLYLHGNGETRAKAWAVKKMIYFSKFADVVTFDYRGFADSGPGSPSEERMIQDAYDVYHYALATFKKRPKDVVVYGHSLGSSVATQLLIKKLCKNQCPAGLVLDSPFASLWQVVQDFVPFINLTHWLGKEFFTHGFDTLAVVSEQEEDSTMMMAQCPVLIVHGKNDAVISYHQAIKLSNALKEKSESVELLIIDNATHTDVFIYPEFQSAFTKYIQHHV